MTDVSDLRPFDAANYLETPQDRADFLTAVLEDGSPADIRRALQTIARSMGMASLAEDAEVSRESLYKSLGENGNPEFATVLKVMKAMGIGFAAIPLAATDASSEAA